MVSDIAGTTRDAIDTRFSDGEESFVIIDTAGIRRKRAIEQQSLERYSGVRALAAIDRCDVALLLIDATQGVTEQDTKIAGYIAEQGKAAGFDQNITTEDQEVMGMVIYSFSASNADGYTVEIFSASGTSGITITAP